MHPCIRKRGEEHRRSSAILMEDERQETSALHHGEKERKRVSLVRLLKRKSDNEIDRFAETMLVNGSC